MADKLYTLLPVTAKDIFALLKVLRAVGTQHFAGILTSEAVAARITGAEGKNDDDKARDVGIAVAMELVGVLVEHLPDCEKQLFEFLARVTNLTPGKIGDLPADVFIDLIIDLASSEELRRLFTRASKLL